MGLFLLFIFIGVPLIEIMLFIKVGGAIGMTLTVVVVVATALIGSFLLRTQGLATMREAQTSVERGEIPIDSVIHGIFLLVAGAFLLTPGFLTDAIGFALFVPPLRLALGRQFMAAALARGGSFTVSGGSSRWTGPGGSPGVRPSVPPGRGPVIDGEASEVDKE
jgi:UPF0716 protein FxsA